MKITKKEIVGRVCYEVCKRVLPRYGTECEVLLADSGYDCKATRK
ncbi:hypothetical protein [Archaeoglobus sp.]